jgi:assimilatory nitrate reductase catalytic subunit
MFCEVAKRMGFKEGFNFKSPHEIFIEHAQLSAAGNDGKRAFNIGAMAELSREDYDNFPYLGFESPRCRCNDWVIENVEN